MLVVAVAAVLAVAGCGDGRLDSGELHDRVKGACEKASKALALAPDPTDDRTTKLFVGQAARATDTLYRELAGLKPPKDAQEGYAFALGLVRDQARLFGSASRSLTAGGDPVIVLRRLSDRSLELSTKERTAWQIVGVEECAER